MEGPKPTGPSPKPGKYLKVSLYLKKKPEVSDEYFHAYWANNHIVPALLNKEFVHKVRRYNQQHITPEYREQAKVFGVPVLDYDGIAEVWVDSLEDWMSVVTSPQFMKDVGPDEQNFILTPIHVMLSYDNMVIGDEWTPKHQ